MHTNSFTALSPAPPGSLTLNAIEVAMNIPAEQPEAFLVTAEESHFTVDISMVQGVVTGSINTPGGTFTLRGLQLLSPPTGTSSAGLPTVPAGLTAGTNPPVVVSTSTLGSASSAVPAALFAQATSPEVIRFTFTGTRSSGDILSGIAIYLQSRGQLFIHAMSKTSVERHVPCCRTVLAVAGVRG
jgi:hypothetical protein